MRVGDPVRSENDGQLGHIVELPDGVWMVKLDRKAQEILVPFEEGRWKPAAEVRLTAMQIARVAYHADQALRLVGGEFGVTDWVNLKDRARMAWLNGPPEGASVARLQLYRAILEALR